jgi:bifunctional non-homologous end joining protein LigD
MTLKQYRQKRTFTKTSEPSGKANRKKTPTSKKKSTSSPIFVIQKHAASHLHYDLRLEVDGVLKSWAVPKGPSLDPANKRLAIMVEDHPYDYHDFEGTIPAGEYGGGTVMVWDKGTYEPLEDMNEGLKKGKMEFILHGEKLSGIFHLVKLYKAEKENEWLFFKGKDEFVSSKDILRQNHSAQTDRTMDEIKNHQKPVKKKG